MEDSVFQNQFKNMDHRLSELEERMTSIDSKLTQVVDAILGNSLTKTGGFVNDVKILEEKVKDLEKQIKKQEEFRKQFMWTVSIIVALGALLQYVTSVYAKIKQ